MRILRLLTCLSYWLLLTAVLLAPHPAAIVRLKRIPDFPGGDLGIHFIAFTILTLLVRGNGWPRCSGWATLLLLVYGVTTESLQALVPPRAVELKDYIANVLGVAAGTALFGCFCIVARKAVPRDGALRRDETSANREVTDEADGTSAARCP